MIFLSWKKFRVKLVTKTKIYFIKKIWLQNTQKLISFAQKPDFK